MISRDRAGVYAEGAREGAPAAIQVADRFHLMQNLGDCLERVAQRGIQLQPAAPDPAPPPEPTPRPPNRSEQAKLATRARRQHRQDTIRELFQQGATIRGIALTLHLNRATVRRYLRGLPDNARSSLLDPFADYLQRRWQEGEHNGRTLYAELRARGYTGSKTQPYVYLQPWRHTEPRRGAVALRAAAQTVSPRAFRRLVLKKARTPEEERLLAAIAASDPALATSITLAQEFARTIRNHDVAAFDAWLDAVGATLPEWRNFAASLRRDLDAVRNGITLSWNQGPLEGSITRLKLIKRAMYGRGSHDLLRRRVLCRLR